MCALLSSHWRAKLFTNNVFKHRMTREAWGWMRGKIVYNIHSPQMTTLHTSMEHKQMFSGEDDGLGVKQRKPTTRTTSTEKKELLQRWRAVSQADIHILVLYLLLMLCLSCCSSTVPHCVAMRSRIFSHSALSNAVRSSDSWTEGPRTTLLYTAAITPSFCSESVQYIPNVYMACCCLPFTENKIP